MKVEADKHEALGIARQGSCGISWWMVGKPEFEKTSNCRTASRGGRGPTTFEIGPLHRGANSPRPSELDELV